MLSSRNGVIYLPVYSTKMAQRLERCKLRLNPQEVGRLVSCAVDVYMLSSAYLVSFTGSCVVAACYEFIMFYIDTWLYVDLLITREANCLNRRKFQDPCD